MNPETAKKLMSDVPEMREFVEYVTHQAEKLNDLSSLRDVPYAERALRVQARLDAFDILVSILVPLLNVDVHTPTGTDPKEFVV